MYTTDPAPLDTRSRDATIPPSYAWRAATAPGRANLSTSADRLTETPSPPVEGTAVQRLAEPWLVRADEEPGFAPLARGSDALGARLRLIDAAERSVDRQSFLIKPDFSSRLMADRLVAAAARGVRVRILVDDIFTTVFDIQFAALDRLPNIEVPVFNPLSRALPKPVGFLVGLAMSNRRAHNKSFTVDNAITIVGGRNNSDEYFEVEETIEFADFDVIAAGPVASDVSASFDLFWNSPLAVGPPSLARPGPTPPAAPPLLVPISLNARRASSTTRWPARCSPI